MKYSASKIFWSIARWTAALVVLGYAVSTKIVPGQSTDLLSYAVKFSFATLLLWIALSELGRWIRRKFILCSTSFADCPLGFGAMASFLYLWTKISISPLLPLTILIICLFLGIRNLLNVNSRNGWGVTDNFLPWMICVVGVTLINIALDQTTGLLMMPTDFDSGLYHVTYPQLVIEKGEYFTPSWLRAPWLPQLTHSWYIFIIALAGVMFLKAINAVCFLQIAKMFVGVGSRGRNSFGLVLFGLLGSLPEFRAVIVSTSQDAILALFLVTAFSLYCRFIKRPTLPLYLLLVVICGFAAGQKHFGLMFSAPILGSAAVFYLWITYRREPAAFRRNLSLLTLSSLPFFFIFPIFYLHNLFHDTSLTFPFLSSGQNGYGWEEIDLKTMKEHVLPSAGHDRSFTGLLSLPSDLIEFSGAYQFMTNRHWTDYMPSAEILLCYLLFLVSIVLFRRTPRIWLPSSVLFAEVILWFFGMQIIRYLFPFIINFLQFIRTLPSRRYVNLFEGRLMHLGCVVVGLTFATGAVVPPIFNYPVTKVERERWLETNPTPSPTRAFSWAKRHLHRHSRYFFVGSMDAAYHYPQLELCGDWFATCRYTKVLKTFIELNEWEQIRTFLKEQNIKYLIIDWKFNTPQSVRPSAETNWSPNIPSSTMACLKHLYFDGVSTDIFAIRRGCLKG